VSGLIYLDFFGNKEGIYLNIFDLSLKENMKKNKIIVVGSTNIDMVVKSSHIPTPGETVLGGAFLMTPGGKGANQAVAIARLGGNATFISKVGNDIFGKQSTQLFDEEGVDITNLLSDNNYPSGVALITVDKLGENSIVVASGANANLTPDNVKLAFNNGCINEAKIVLMQLEIPMETVNFAASFAHSKAIYVIINPAPYNPLIEELFQYIDIITTNITEAEKLSGIEIKDIESARKAAEIIHKKGINHVIITLGKLGALLLEDGEFHMIDAPIVDAVDTTAAGDVFNGALAVAIAEEKNLIQAVQFACQAAAISVMRMGAQSSIPFRNEMILSDFEKVIKKTSKK